MLVSAALRMRQASLLLIDPNDEDLLNRLRRILKGLGYSASWDKGMTVKCLKLNSHRAFCSNGRGERPFFGLKFHDYDWKARATQKAEMGPFGRIQEIRRKSAPWDRPGYDQYLAFGGDGTFLFELTCGGAEKLVQENEDIRVVGWSP